MDAPRVELNMLEPLLEIRRLSDVSTAQTQGLSDEVIERFCNLDPQLIRAIDEASISFASLVEEVGLEYLTQDETTLVSSVQSEYINFYSAATINPYVAIAARGPWVITSKGAVLHDNGSYGMLGSGHGPATIIDSMSE